LSRIFVTGIGIISSIGNNASENHYSLRQEKGGIGEAVLLSSKYTSQLPFGEVKKNNEQLRQELQVFEKGVTRTSLLALHAFNEAIQDAAISHDVLSNDLTCFINATTVGGMCLTDELYHDANKKEEPSEYVRSYDCASIALYLQKRYQMRGIINTINTACSSSANAVMYGARLIQQGFAKRAIVGGADSLAKFTINGFNALHILSSEKCRPFDAKRNGLNLGEGAAFLVLEKEKDIAGKRVYAELTGYANTNDAFHASSLSDNGEGPYLSMKLALEKAGLRPEDIDYINAHGTGTENNDEVESRAMLRLFETVPSFASTKSYTGHTLGAAGAVEAVYSLFNIQHQELYKGLQFEEPIAATGLLPVASTTKKQVKHVMSNSFGFGGNCSTLIFSKA
jgi:3-oxoacyl-(acyl-carrier-protein) synthase